MKLAIELKLAALLYAVALTAAMIQIAPNPKPHVPVRVEPVIEIYTAKGVVTKAKL